MRLLVHDYPTLQIARECPSQASRNHDLLDKTRHNPVGFPSAWPPGQTKVHIDFSIDQYEVHERTDTKHLRN